MKRGQAKLITSILLILVLGFTILAYSSTENTKIYDEQTKTVSIKNNGEDIASITLNTPLHYKVRMGYDVKVAEFTINNINEASNVFNNLEFYDINNGMKSTNKNYKLKYKTTEQKEIIDYQKNCNQVDYPNGSKGEACEYTQTGSHFANVESWKEISNTLPAGETTIGIFVDIDKPEKVEWIPTLFNTKIEEWADYESLQDAQGWYSYDHSGSLGGDDSGNENNATAVGSPAQNTTGYKLIASAEYDAGERFDTPINPNSWTEISLCSWYFRATSQNDFFTGWANGNRDGEMGNLVDGNDVFFKVLTAGGTENYCGYSTTVTKGWHHICGTYNGATIVVYLDAKRLKSCSATGTIDSATNLALVGNTRTGYNFDGTQDEVGVWNRVLTDGGCTDGNNCTGEISILYSNGLACNPITGLGCEEENNPPTITLQSPENSSQLTPGSVNFIYNVTDPDADTVDNCSLYIDDVEDQTDTSITQTINQSFTKSLSTGDYKWKVTCYDNLSLQGTSQVNNLSIAGINNPPTIDVPSITPDPAYTNTQLQCSVKAYDVDLDSITIEFKWYNNSVYTAFENISTSNGTLVSSYLTSGLQAKDETWNCTVRAFDGQNISSTESDIITISNTAPTHDNPILSSTSDYNASNENLTCQNQNTQDLDNDVVTKIYSWYLDSNPLAKLNMPFEIDADDYSGSGNDGTINGGANNFVDGKSGQALEFDGEDDKVTVGDIGIPANGPATIEGWFKFKQFAQGSSHKGLYSILYQHSGDNNLYIPGTNELFYVASYLNLNVWHHIVLTYNGDSSTAKLYIDNSEYNVAVQGEGQTIPALDNFLVGDRGYDLFFNGTIDEVRVYNRVLSEDEVDAHYNLDYNKLVSSETSEDDVFKCKVVPNDGSSDGSSLESNTVTIEKNVYNITFDITEGEFGNDLTGVLFACDNGFSTTTSVNSETHKFYEGSYSCEFKAPGQYNKTKIFTADNDKQIDIILSLKQDMTIQEHNWLAAIYECLYEGDCLALDLLEEINETTEKLWDQFQPTDESVVLQEDILSSRLNSTQNITINYTIRAPPKAGYSTGDYAPMRIAFWFLDENNETCLDQDKVTSDSNRVEESYCIPLIAETLAIVNQDVTFTVELRPNLPAGSYDIVRDIEIDPNEIWIRYGQEIIDSIDILESNNNADVFVVTQEQKENFDDLSETQVVESSRLNIVTSSATTNAVEKTTAEIKSLLSGGQIVGIIGMILAFLTIIIICFTILKIKTK